MFVIVSKAIPADVPLLLDWDIPKIKPNFVLTGFSYSFFYSHLAMNAVNKYHSIASVRTILLRHYNITKIVNDNRSTYFRKHSLLFCINRRVSAKFRAFTLKLVSEQSKSSSTTAPYILQWTEHTWSTFTASVVNTNKSSFLNRDFPAVVIHTYAFILYIQAALMGDGYLVMMTIVADIHIYVIHKINREQLFSIKW